MHNLEEDSRIVGYKQTIRALEKGLVKVVYVAMDASEDIRTRVIEKAKTSQAKIIYVDTMKDLGNACDVSVKTAIAAIIN